MKTQFFTNKIVLLKKRITYFSLKGTSLSKSYEVKHTSIIYIYLTRHTSISVTDPGSGAKTISARRALMPHKTSTFIPAWPAHGPAPAAGTKTKPRPVVSQPSSGQHLSTFSDLSYCLSHVYLCRSILVRQLLLCLFFGPLCLVTL